MSAPSRTMPLSAAARALRSAGYGHGQVAHAGAALPPIRPSLRALWYAASAPLPGTASPISRRVRSPAATASRSAASSAADHLGLLCLSPARE